MRTSPFLKSVDCAEMEARFSNENAIRYNEISDSTVSYEDIRPFLDRLPPREIDLIELYFHEKKNQKDIAKMFGVTQGAVSSRLARAKKRMKFLRNLPKISDQEIEDGLNKYFDVLELEIIKCMMATTCQSKTAEIINQKYDLHDEKTRMTQVKVRHRFEKARIFLKTAKDKNPELAKFYDLLSFIKKNLYMLHEVKLPHFDRGYSAVMGLSL